MTEVKSNIAAALAGAQSKMSKAIKESTNPHFRSKYADLGSVMDACMSSLNDAGICVIQPIVEVGGARFVKTVFLHESGDTLECSVPLIVGKNDMQGLGSAITYARRYGLMSMAGIAPEDDDGNAAAKAPPKAVSPDQFIKLRDKAQEAGVAEAKVASLGGVTDLQQFPADKLESAMKKLDATIAANAKTENDDLGGDDIPQEFEGKVAAE